MIKVPRTLDLDALNAKLIQSINYSPVVLPFAGPVRATIDTSGAHYHTMLVDRGVFRGKLPNARWVVWLAGIADATDANGMTVDIRYIDDSITGYVVATTTLTGAGAQKFTMGPADVFATASVPQGETVPDLAVRAIKNTTGTGTLFGYTLWLELRAPAF